MPISSPPGGPAAIAPVSAKIFEAIAQAEGTTTRDLDQPIYHDVDTDALNTLFRDDSSNLTVTFTYQGYLVTVHSDRDVTIRNASGDSRRNTVCPHCGARLDDVE